MLGVGAWERSGVHLGACGALSGNFGGGRGSGAPTPPDGPAQKTKSRQISTHLIGGMRERRFCGISEKTLRPTKEYPNTAQGNLNFEANFKVTFQYRKYFRLSEEMFDENCEGNFANGAETFSIPRRLGGKTLLHKKTSRHILNVENCCLSSAKGAAHLLPAAAAARRVAQHYFKRKHHATTTAETPRGDPGNAARR